MTKGQTPGRIDDHERQWLTVGQAARLLGVSAQTVRKWTDAGTLTSLRTQGGHRRYRRAVIEQLAAGGRPAGGEFELLVGTAQSIGSSVELNETLMAVTRSITETLGVAWSDFYEWFPDEQIIEVTAYYQIPEVPVWEDWVGTRLGAENMRDWSLTIDEHKPSLAYRDDPDITDAEREAMDEYGEKATLTVPIVYRDEVLGMLDVGESRWNRRYTEDEVRLLTAIANQAASAIHNARTFEESKQRATELATLLEVSESLSSSNDVEEMLAVLCEKLRIALDVFSAEAYVYDSAAGTIRMLANKDLEPIDLGDWDGSYLVSDVPMIGRAISEMQPVVAQVNDPDLPEVSRQDMQRWGERSSLSVPMVHGGGVVGLVYLSEIRGGHTFDARDVRLATAIAAQGAVAVENARAYAQIARQAITDGLTGLYNHGHLQERLEQEVARAKRHGMNLSVLMLDIDDFKKFNDAYGHPQGDRLLKEIAQVLLTSTRLNVDLVARYGGEEFCILLPNTPPQLAPVDDTVRAEGSAEVVAERIRESVAAARFEGFPSRREAAVTVSIGVASLPTNAGTGDDLVANADEALYRAKRGGKNKVHLYGA